MTVASLDVFETTRHIRPAGIREFWTSPAPR